MTIAQVSKQYGVPADTLRYYEKAGMIPPVHRTLGGLRDYTDEDCGWVELAKCMRSAGVQVEAIAEYVRLAQQGDKTLADRCQLLKEQRVQLAGQLQSIEAAMERLDYKISRYEEAVKTGVLHWD